MIFAYRNCPFGPYIAETVDEVKAILEIARDRIEKMIHKEEKSNTNSYIPRSAVAAAESTLGPEMTQRIRQSFNKNVMRKRTAKIRRNTQKRSEVIKIDPVTKELIHPNGERKQQSDVGTSGEKEIEQSPGFEFVDVGEVETEPDANDNEIFHVEAKLNEDSDEIIKVFHKEKRKRKSSPKLKKYKSKWCKN